MGLSLCSQAVIELLLVILCGNVERLPAAEPATEAPRKSTNAEADARRQEMLALWNDAHQQEAAGKLDEAVATVGKLLPVARSSGDTSDEFVLTLDYLASLETKREHFTAAREARNELLQIKLKQFGEHHWQATNARLDLAWVDTMARLSAPQRAKLAEAQDLLQKATALSAKGQYADALADVQAAFDRLAAILGQTHRATNFARTSLANISNSLGQYARAEPLYKQIAEIDKDALGEDHPTYATDLNNLALVYQSMGEYARAEPLYRQASDIDKKAYGERHPGYATDLNNLALLYQSMGDYARAEPLYQQALEIRKQVLGEAHPDYAVSLSNLAGLYDDQGDAARAESLYKQVLEIRKRVLGEAHPSYATSLNNLAALYASTGDYAEAESLYKQALEICKKSLGEQHPNYATCVNNLAFLYKTMGDYVHAEPLYQQALQIKRKASGEQHPDYATCLNNLALLYQAMSDFARAEPLYKQALEIRRKALGEAHPDYANSLNSLAGLYDAMGDFARALPLYRQASETYKRVWGDAHPLYATSLNNLAWLYQSMGDYARAEPLYKQAVSIKRKALGQRHPDYAASLNNLAGLYQTMGDYSRAEPLARQACEIDQKALGEQHPRYASDVNNLAGLYQLMGDYRRAEPLTLKAIEIGRRQLELTAAIQSERQQLAMNDSVRGYLDTYLTIAADARWTPSKVYEQVLAWKGAVSARQQFIHQAREAATNRPDVAQLYAALERTNREFAARVRVVPIPAQQEAQRRQLAGLSEKIEDFEQQLARASVEYRERLAQRQRTAADIAAALPDRAALVDVLEYWHRVRPQKPAGKATWQRRMVAFVVRPHQAVAQIDLAAAEPIERAVDAWRRRFARAGESSSAQNVGPENQIGDPANELRKLVWDKLAPHVKGATTLLVSPDGSLARFPWPALTTDAAGHYLIETAAVAIVPIPQLLPELLATDTERHDKERDESMPSLLVVGDVDYGASTGAPASPAQARSAGRSDRADALSHWSPLIGTGPEVQAVNDMFQKSQTGAHSTSLGGAEATEEHVRHAAPQCRYLHFATHGFFAPAQLRSALAFGQLDVRGQDFITRHDVAGFHPGLLSGIVLAGANQPVSPDRDDGILTALEVADLDLRRVDLVTLSACETGLGKTAGGEGLLGLQRAFQIAGARTVVASLWTVDDEATRQLMVDFYSNLWQKKLTKSEALRQAQRTMMRAGVGPAPSVAKSSDKQSRGLSLLDERPRAIGQDRPPFYWAAFVLSGDWR